MRILFEKYLGKERLDGWTRTFDNTQDLIDFMIKKQNWLLSPSSCSQYYRIVVTALSDEQI